MNRQSLLCFASIALVLASIACRDIDGDNILGTSHTDLTGTWSVQVVSSGSRLTNCEGLVLIPPNPTYSGLLQQADVIGAIEVEQAGDRFVLEPVIVQHPSGLTTTYSGDGDVIGIIVIVIVTLELKVPDRPESQFNSESLQGYITGPSSVRLKASHWTAGSGNCDIVPPIEYEIVIE
jgi:hypothetical protein